MCYTIVTMGKENPEHQKGYSMEYSHFETETVSPKAYENIRVKFRSAYTQDDLEYFYIRHVPVSVRWHNRNVYGSVCKLGVTFLVCNFYRIKRDGTPIRLYVGLDSVVCGSD